MASVAKVTTKSGTRWRARYRTPEGGSRTCTFDRTTTEPELPSMACSGAVVSPPCHVQRRCRHFAWSEGC